MELELSGADQIMNEHKKAMIEEIVEQTEVQKLILQEKAVTSLYLFNKYVLQAESGSDNFVKLGQFHRELCHFVDDNKKYKKLILLPRGHLKSKLVTVGYCLQQIVKDPTVRILIYNATWQMSVDFLGEIKRQLTNNEQLLDIFGDVAANPMEWSQDRIKLRQSNKKEPTIMATGIDTNVVSSHFDIIIFDDVVNRDNASTKDQLEKVIKRYRDHNALLEPGGETIVIGTRWDDKDLYNWILEPQNEVGQSFKVLSKAALEGYYWDNAKREFVDSGQGQILWPEKYDLTSLNKIRREMGSYDFSTQYMNDPVPDSEASFRKDFFQYYDREIIRNKRFNIITTCDPALSLTKEADFTAIITVGIDEFANVFILDMIRKKMTPDELIDELFATFYNHRPGIMGIEDVAITKTLGFMLKQKEREKKRFLPLKPIAPHNRTKYDRIIGLQPLYENLKVFHPASHPVTPFLEDELTRFPRGAHDDLVDALSYTLDFLYPPRGRSRDPDDDDKPRKTRYLY